MRLAKTRLFIAAAMLSAPLGVLVYNKQADEVPNVQKIGLDKKAIDEKRTVLEIKERELAQELGGYASSSLPNLLINLYMVSDGDDVLIARNIAFKLSKRSDEFIGLTGNDYSIKKPNEEQVEAFTRLLNMAEKGVPLALPYADKITLQEISKKIEKYLQKNNPELKGEKLKEEVKHILEYFEVYQQDVKDLTRRAKDFSTLMRDFDNEAIKANESVYGFVWGVDDRKLQKLLPGFAIGLK